MGQFSLAANGIRKDFSRRVIFDHVSFGLALHESLSITGRNGSGKSTLVKILSGILSPTAGSIAMIGENGSVALEERREYLGFVAPYLQLYDEFTGREMLFLAGRIRGKEGVSSDIDNLLKRVGLFFCKDDYVGTYSSGMKQRLKYAFALHHQPALLILDEPMSNLDEAGIEMVESIIEEQKEKGIIIIATNDAEEAKLCQQNLDLNLMKPTETGVFS